MPEGFAMKTIFKQAIGWLVCCVLMLAALASFGASAAQAPVYVIPLNGAVGPASADFVVRSMDRAAHAQLIVLELDTPSGLDLSMRKIIQSILASPVPVAAFIAPGGARAASAGTYIVYASHIAAMAPGTNLGAATPIRIGAGETSDKAASASQSTETRKQIQDAAAYIHGLAQLRGRNAQWAERAVREAVALSADEALAQNVIDLTATNVPDLLTKLDGRRVRIASGKRVLATKDAPLVALQPDWRSHFLATITDPSIVLILMMVGVYGLFFEFANPGFVLPGVAGAISLLIGLFALQLLPVNFVGLGLIVLGLGFLVAELFLPTFGTLGIGGMAAFAIGALILIDTDAPGFGIPVGVIAGLALFTALFVFTVSSVALKARRRPVVIGSEAMLGSIGVMLGGDWAQVHGERWRVRVASASAETDALPARGERVRVIARDGLTLTVEALINEHTD
ncbi:putative membrane-bound ClpP-class protease [Candidatus Burkholderia verschuerenii]|uniref:Putative membrane-bound ClpP-class protease n=2 Tax=Candidatus Burkholderia verschuerenii TaxID=242163 RepID=A0A0L0ME39_9BURK|nr:putative membrane-bound ClpP-class protease [Candidatus Burkholderia verschuerenii]